MPAWRANGLLDDYRSAARTLSRWASRTRSSPPTSAVSDTDFGAVLGAGPFLAEFAFVGSRNLMPDEPVVP